VPRTGAGPPAATPRAPRPNGCTLRRSWSGGGWKAIAATIRRRELAGRPEKHSLTLKGHRTSVSLEPEFWHAFRAIAAGEGRPLNALAAEIDAARGVETGLASAIRLHVLAWYRARAQS
jgi:predicted DNA-binding ribbon-helix-helix protein